MKDLDDEGGRGDRPILRAREEDAPAMRPVRMSRTLIASAALFALGQLACERGHYATRDHVVTEESAGAETAGPEDVSATESTDTGGASDAPSGGVASVSETPSGGETATAETTETETTETETATTETATIASGREGHAPEEEMARARVLASQSVTIRVHTTSGPLTRAVAERALGMQRMHVDHCYRTVAGPSSAGSMRASIHVESSGAARVELETMTPELDRVLPCVDAALERTPFPASSDGRPTHVVAEIARTP